MSSVDTSLLTPLIAKKSQRRDQCNPDQRYSRLHSLAVTGHVHLQVVRVVQHLRSKQIVLQITPQLRELKQFTIIKYSPAGREQKGDTVNVLHQSFKRRKFSPFALFPFLFLF